MWLYAENTRQSINQQFGEIGCERENRNEPWFVGQEHFQKYWLGAPLFGSHLNLDSQKSLLFATSRTNQLQDDGSTKWSEVPWKWWRPFMAALQLCSLRFDTIVPVRRVVIKFRGYRGVIKNRIVHKQPTKCANKSFKLKNVWSFRV